MLSLSYSFHIGNDKNKSKKAMKKNVLTNYNNNAIQNARQLSKVNHHNLRQYDNNQDKIKILYGSNDIVNDVKFLYLSEFEDARLEYNEKQVREDRKIDNYFNKISNDTKHDLAVEIIIELGDMEYWEDKSYSELYMMTEVYNEQVMYLKELVPDFKVANATIHFDESSPHLHIVGVAVKDNCKTGMSKQVGKCSVFNKDNLSRIQDMMRDKCIESFNRVYDLDAVLKDKKRGRNIDYRIDQMVDYIELRDSYNIQRERIDRINNDFESLNSKSNEVKDIINNLSNQPLSKSKFILYDEDKEKILDYIDEVNKSNNDFKEITDYSLCVDKIIDDFEENHKCISELTNEVMEKKKEIRNLRSELNDKEEEISYLEAFVDDLKEKLDYWKNKFNKVIEYIRDKAQNIFGDRDSNVYEDMADDLYINNVIDNKEYNKIINHKEKERDNFCR